MIYHDTILAGMATIGEHVNAAFISGKKNVGQNSCEMSLTAQVRGILTTEQAGVRTDEEAGLKKQDIRAVKKLGIADLHHKPLPNCHSPITNYSCLVKVPFCPSELLSLHDTNTVVIT